MVLRGYGGNKKVLLDGFYVDILFRLNSILFDVLIS